MKYLKLKLLKENRENTLRHWYRQLFSGQDPETLETKAKIDKWNDYKASAQQNNQ
jgi:hypothetical protein